MKFDLFVLPFTLGLVFLLGYLAVTYGRWYTQMNRADRSKVYHRISEFQVIWRTA